MKLNRSKKGFTLIELMIVVAIIGILAAVAVPKFADLVTKSKEASVKGALGSVRSALSIYYGDTEGAYPSDMWKALTTSNKYMPAVAGTQSLGRFAVPAQSTSNPVNPGHTTGFFANASGSSAVLYNNTATADDGNAALVTGNIGQQTQGEVYVNCTHMDTKGQQWTGY